MVMLMRAKFGIDHININFQRNKNDPDKDLVNFQVGTTHNFAADAAAGVFTGDQPLDIRSEILGVPIGTPSSGALVGPPLDPPIESGEVFFMDFDDIVITCRITNGSHTDDASHFFNALKVGGCVAAVLGGGPALAEKVKLFKVNSLLKSDLESVGLAGLIVALAGEFLSDYGVALGLVEPDCDGPVFESLTSGSIIKIPGSLIADGISKGAIQLNKPFFLAGVTDDTQVSQDHCGHNPSTTITPMVTVTHAQPLVPLFPILPGVATKYKARAGHIPALWLNTWGDRDTIEGSRILCTVQESALANIGTAVSGDVVRAKLTLAPNVADLIGSVPQGPGRPKTELPASAAAPGTGFAPGEGNENEIAVVAQHVLDISVRENLDSPSGKELANANSDAAFTVPMSATSFNGNLFPLDIKTFEHLHFEILGAAAPSPPTGGGAAVSLVHSAAEFADSIVLDGGVTLQLYDAFDASNRLVGPRLRYRRINPESGFTDTDVMLQPAQPVPK